MDPWYALFALGVLVLLVGVVAVFMIKTSDEHAFKLGDILEIKSTGTGVFLVSLGAALCLIGLLQASRTDVRVTSATLTTDTGGDSAQYYVRCPINVRLTGEVTVAGDPGTVSYRLDRQDGLNAPIQQGTVETLAFDAPGTRQVNFDVPITIPEGEIYFESTLVVIDPTDMSSNPVRVEVVCDPDLPAGPPSPPPDVEPPTG